MNRDWMEKDFYAVLGISPEAPDEEIKKSYRKLAQEHHPDANSGDADSEAKFKEISEAYATLSDSDQRKEYDQVRRLAASGFQGFSGGAGGQQVRVEDLSDLLGGFGNLGDLFGFGTTNTRSGPAKGQDQRVSLTIKFADAVNGLTTAVNIRGATACSLCGGSGAQPGTNVTTCPTCAGRGVVAKNQGFFSFSETCGQCNGSGRVVDTPCTSCHGSGSETRDREVKVRIPAGIQDGNTLFLRGKGGPGRNGGPPGDLLIQLRVAPSARFGRKGQHLTLTVPITFPEAALGFKIDVPTLNGTVKLKVPAGTPSGKTFRVRGQGVTPERGKAGDLLVTVQVAVPRKISKDEKRILEDLADHGDDDVRAHLK